MHPRSPRSLALLAVALLAVACGSSTPEPETTSLETARTRIDGRAAISAIIEIIHASSSEGAPTIDDLLDTTPTADGDLEYYRKSLAWLVWRVALGYEVDGAEMAYEARALDEHGQPMKRWLSGAAFMPVSSSKISVPIVVYTHGTELLRSLVASRGLVEKGYSPTLGGLEGLFGVALASAGPAIVLMPDFQGMGADDDPTYYHPYVHRDSLAWAGIDMVKGFQALVKAKPDFLPANVTWNGKLHVMGYSEGGFAAMAFAREWEAMRAAGPVPFPVDCAAPMAGPHNLSQRMVPLMTDTSAPFGQPFFLPYVIFAYERLYPTLVKADEALHQDYMSKGLRTWMGGTFKGSWVNERIWAIGGDKVPVGKLLDPAWADANLRNPSPVLTAIASNNTVARRGTAGAWTNSMPMYLIHSATDDLVVYANSQDAKSWLTQWTESAGVSLRTVNPNGWKPGHAAAAPWALMGGMYWLMNGCKE